MRGLIAKTGRTLLDGVLKCHLKNAGRIAVFGPCPQDHLDAIVESDRGLQYVDCGRGYDWRPRLDGLRLVLEDGAVAVWIASPNYPTGTCSELNELEKMMEGYPGVQLLVDQRWAYSPYAQFASSDSRTLYLRRFSGLDQGSFQVLLCGSSLQELEWEVDSEVRWLDMDGSGQTTQEQARKTEWASDFDPSRYRVTHGSGDWLFVQAPGTDGAVLASELRQKGYKVDYEAVHTWRNGVSVWGRNHEG